MLFLSQGGVTISFYAYVKVESVNNTLYLLLLFADMRKFCIFAQIISFMERQPDNNMAKRFLKMEMLRRGISSEKLQTLLSEKGYSYTLSSINSKISRGTFSASFLIQCLEAMKCDKIELNSLSVSYE